MKTRPFYLMLAFLVLVAPSIPSPMAANAPGTIVLMAEDVTSAVDIEAAIQQATQWGARPGKVILDGSQGPFVYTEEDGADRTINLFYSHLILRGKNKAILSNSDGIFFDEVHAEHILIADFSMNCLADCIVSWGDHKDVRIQNMQLLAGGIGIQVAQTEGWLIRNNKITAGSTAVEVLDANLIKINQNRLAGNIPIKFQNAKKCQAAQNNLKGSWQGVLLTSPSSENIVIRNRIKGVESSGVALEPGTYKNTIIRNVVICATGADCLTVDADKPTLADNHVVGNQP